MNQETSVLIRIFDETGNQQIYARAWVDESGTIQCDNLDLLRDWQNQGIIGRESKGHLFPNDGRAFLEELPFMYKGAYFMAELVKPGSKK